jgi:hypothetical protein
VSIIGVFKIIFHRYGKIKINKIMYLQINKLECKFKTKFELNLKFRN